MLTTIITTCIYTISSIYMLLNFKRDIHAFQQNSYRVSRYYRWLKNNMVTAWRLYDVAMLFLLLSTLLLPLLSGIIIAISAIVKCVMILRAKYKKPLVMTKRVWRLYTCVGVISLGILLPFCLLPTPDLIISPSPIPDFVNMRYALSILLLITIFSWALLIAAAWIMTPVEKHIAGKYRKDAQRILATMPDLKIIGITGSFGKTSTKHYLHRILSEKYDVLMTPGSFNTPMGVIRTIREHLKPYNEIFICEMGAKQKGDVKEICELVRPEMGIITAVGPMHLETFKSIDNVQSTKFELADALPQDGLIVVNNDFEYCANRAVDNVETIRYAVVNTDNVDYRTSEIKYTPAGTEFTITGPSGIRLTLNTKLIGECNISNLMAAAITALRLGVEPERIKYAVSQIEQVEHRLNVKRTAGGVTIIDDAFNSNPEGSRMAVEALSRFTGGRRIIVTPGMIELGDKQYELNKALGKHIASGVDIAVVVGQYNRQAILDGINSAGKLPDNSVVPVDSFNEAQKFLATFLQSGDTVLYENDLPDTFK